MTDNNEKRFRSTDTLVIRNARVMFVSEPKEINDTTTLCSFKVVSQPGGNNDRDLDCWVTVTGANKLGERIFGLTKGDRVNVAGKPYFGAYINKDGAPVPTVEIKFPDYLDVLRGPAAAVEETATEEPVVEDKKPVVAASKTAPEKRGPGRPKKMPFDEE